ncbi:MULTISPECIES: Asp-tRNA(Asn)/Glu-tRNA(Gln) amidotransferase subunit GatB [unclassified Oceanispirochaeta]|uniref:Asp-tRNA(Asn)/Glu-tRNA(Gln) amidotransferase subunit GatB n=1 Tax=unclassified Oceanispirochaeta TaxID=2635722 RepID=UPI000E093A6D|nr:MULTISPECIES: Asp-tRNA(Asn)/Glu-tRNA(Gln) amidotransferase subunit GatB [unclassified Oceanispirochaeta]MBF9016260.1 Asp-tRNA(Asn)/Glu-tRNA(Gln) amidotransferase subunit GatB [Oceanispirochaeta sp. M2]NPD72722.1 Asp-tRNA(Asn)/Glu-tRNA(Gln) amidotransferase subunit GatB [Oceanispirochaeta sp. M1]RDG31869.1 Asp-tRNA(Asn)/Glu-tRNA(Gln) amidotransferase subunit GatB [Oceanispirochaeta sp. M1]
MYQSFIGLEIHIHLTAETKAFCGCKAHFGDEENTNICPVCMGFPGVLPTLNEKAMQMSYVVARALNCTLSPNTKFDRKNYFYPDMPKNYQISQFSDPVGRDGYIDIEIGDSIKRVRIHDVHFEEDAGKMIHAGDMSLLDYNRAGYPLLEVVTEPDLVIGEDAEAFLKSFRRLVRYLGVCDGNMDEGSMRCDANVSINHQGAGLGPKVEIKNLNSSRFVRKALNYEIGRQSEFMDADKKIDQETRLWNENRDQSEPMRKKEDDNDYRYFPEPDLPPFKPSAEFLKNVENGLCELPLVRKQRLMKSYGLNSDQAEYIHEEKFVADFFEQAVFNGADAVQVYSWLSSDVKKLLNRKGISLENSPLSAERLAKLIDMIADDQISGKIAKKVLDYIFDEDQDPETICIDKKLVQISDPGVIGKIVDEVMAAHSNVVEAVKAGDARQMGFLVGQIMKVSGGNAAPAVVQSVLKEKVLG